MGMVWNPYDQSMSLAGVEIIGRWSGWGQSKQMEAECDLHGVW